MYRDEVLQSSFECSCYRSFGCHCLPCQLHKLSRSCVQCPVWGWLSWITCSVYAKSKYRSQQAHKCSQTLISHKGALIIRLGFWSPLYYTYNKEPPKLVLRTILASILAGSRNFVAEFALPEFRTALQLVTQATAQGSVEP